MEREEFADTMGQLPDALAFMKEMNARVWVRLNEEGPLSAGELVDRMEVSHATVYRRVRDLKDAGLAEDVSSLEHPGCTFYGAVDPSEVDHAVWQ